MDVSLTMNWNHGATGLLVVYGISALVVLIGLIAGRAPTFRILAFPLMAIPICIVALILWTAMVGPLRAMAISSDAIPYLGFIFVAIISGLAGKLLAKLPENKNHKRGTILSDSSRKIARGILNPKALSMAGMPSPRPMKPNTSSASAPPAPVNSPPSANP